MLPSDIKTEDESEIEQSKLYRGTMDALTSGTQDGLQITLNIAVKGAASCFNYNCYSCEHWSRSSSASSRWRINHS